LVNVIDVLKSRESPVAEGQDGRQGPVDTGIVAARDNSVHH
jgi:hypothetical protein